MSKEARYDIILSTLLFWIADVLQGDAWSFQLPMTVARVGVVSGESLSFADAILSGLVRLCWSVVVSYGVDIIRIISSDFDMLFAWSILVDEDIALTCLDVPVQIKEHRNDYLNRTVEHDGIQLPMSLTSI